MMSATGRKSLYLSSHAGRIVGWPEPEAKAFLMDLTEMATQREFTYSHTWAVGDLVVWDNQRTMAIGMDQIALVDLQPHHPDRLADGADMDKSMARTDAACDHGKALRQVTKVTDHPIRQCP